MIFGEYAFLLSLKLKFVKFFKKKFAKGCFVGQKTALEISERYIPILNSYGSLKIWTMVNTQKWFVSHGVDYIFT